MSRIQDSSFSYELLRTFVRFIYPKFFRQIEIRGTENIPSGEPVIFAPNHQNGLLDALAVVLYQKDPVVFMARADMFQSPLNRKLLKFLKLSPIYRIRDGFENLSKNETQMKGATEILLDHKSLCLMPEGNHGDQHKLRPLVKGLFRIAYSAEEGLNGQAHVKIIPVGIDYNFYQHAGSDLVVTYGKPLEVKDYIHLQETNPANALNVLRDDLAAALSPLIQDIKSTSHYDIIYRICCYGTPAYLEVQAENGVEMGAKTMAGLRFDARCALGKMLDKMQTENTGQILQWDALCLPLNNLPGYPSEVTEWIDEKHSKGYNIALIILSIMLIPGFLLNYPTWLISHLICKKMEDSQMHSTFAFTIGMLLNVIVYLSAALFIGIILNATFMQAIVGLIFVSVLGIVSERARQSLRIPLRRFFYSFGSRKKMVKKCMADYEAFKTSLKKYLRAN